MGWTSYCDPSRVQGYADEKAEIKRLCTFENDTLSQGPLQMSKVGSTWYAAVKTTPRLGVSLLSNGYTPDDDGSYTFAAVILVKYHERCFGYKAMDETMGPCESRAPISLLKKLSPLCKPDSYAHAWRARCHDFANIPKFAIGDVIKLGSPIKTQDGNEIKTVRKDFYMRRGKKMPVYIDIDTGNRWRLEKVRFAGATLVSSEATQASPVLAEFAARSG